MNAPDRRRLEHILDSIDRIVRYTEGGKAAFMDSEVVRDAVLYCLAVIGEAAGALTDVTYETIGSLPPDLPKGQRNVIIHEYWRVNLDRIWLTIENDLPPLRDEIADLLAAG